MLFFALWPVGYFKFLSFKVPVLIIYRVRVLECQVRLSSGSEVNL
ncbi:hypothetical protein QWZ13_09650 [Reinekea marina]|nr:hypothetical protein [Reinekea marina]MDN3649174.1 hypothetical protein [Reinekea marina]